MSSYHSTVKLPHAPKILPKPKKHSENMSEDEHENRELLELSFFLAKLKQFVKNEKQFNNFQILVIHPDAEITGDGTVEITVI